MNGLITPGIYIVVWRNVRKSNAHVTTRIVVGIKKNMICSYRKVWNTHNDSFITREPWLI